MPDSGTRCGDAPIALFLRRRDGFRGRAPALDLNTPTGLGQVRFASHAGVAAVGIYVAAGVVWIKQVFEHAGVGDGCIGDDDFADQFIALVDAGVQFVTEVALVVFLGPLGSDILLCTLSKRDPSTVWT